MLTYSSSGNELYRNGVQGSRGYEQRAMGSLFDYHARNRQWNLQLVRFYPWEKK